MPSRAVPIEAVEVAVYVIPTDAPESDGTFEWTSTTLVLVTAYAGGKHGLGYSYAHRAAAEVVTDTLAPIVRGRNALDVDASWAAMLHAVRNIGLAGIAATAISAVDTALW